MGVEPKRSPTSRANCNDPEPRSNHHPEIHHEPRRNSRDYEYFVESSESMIKACSIHRMLRVLSPDVSKKAVPFKYRKLQEINTG